jgi:hypothetical protein
MGMRRNQKKLARFFAGIASVFFAVCAYQWFEEDSFRSRFGSVVTKADDPFQFWTAWSAVVVGSGLLLWTCITWKNRSIAKRFADDE